jgi:regulator of RNase E activity RraA
MVHWNDDKALSQLAGTELYTAVVGDIMDKIGLVHQFLSPRLRPLRDDMKIFGRAMTVLEADWPNGTCSQAEFADKPFGLMLEALDDLRPGEVYLCSGAIAPYALWGELMSAAAACRGAAGAIVDGYSRDTSGILALDFPCFSYGPYAQDQAPRGRVVDFRCQIELAGVQVNPGDWVMADLDGVCVIPREAEREVFEKAVEKARGERTVLKAILNGMGAMEAFHKYGIM